MKVLLAKFNETKYDYEEVHPDFIKIELGNFILSVTFNGENFDIHTNKGMIIIPHVTNNIEIKERD